MDLNPLGLIDGVLGGQSTDWEPPMAAELESCFPGYTDFQYIDRGGMGAVYSAMQTSLERRVAVKILPPDLGADPVFVDGFHREARLLGRLQHPHIVTVYDFGRNDLGHLFIVMEFVEGTSLLDVMKKGKLPVPRVLEIISQVCDALQFAHDHGVVHRDIKPTNILIDVRGGVRVADFGLARHMVAEGAAVTHARSSLVMGTPAYAAPEQRLHSRTLDHRADIYSVGVMLYEMLTGQVPVGVFEPPSKKAGSPAALDKIITRSLRESPDERYQKTGDLRTALEKTAARLKQPVIQHTIASRPIISMMTTVIVTSGLIYLFGELNVLLQKNKLAVHEVREDQTGDFIPLDDTFMLVSSRMTWSAAEKLLEGRPDLELASFHSMEEVTRVTHLLRERGIHSPLWTGGRQTEPGGKFSWSDGTPFDFEAWMPASPAPPLVITEVQARNKLTLRTPTGDTPDWIEVYNSGSQPVDMTGWQLRHHTNQYVKTGRLGEGQATSGPEMMLGPGEYRVLKCYDLEDKSGPHFDFQLEAQNGRIVWADPRGNVIQSFDRNWSEFPLDASIMSDTSGMKWRWSGRPTPGAPNVPGGRVLELSVAPVVKDPLAIYMLPEFEGRWCMETPRRNALPLVRKKLKK
ncbi:MAG: protein kinase domain-containing protein [Prosthecobacter sp.]